jgi:FlaA1/EpsC-like NDP-sugar epimerase
MIKELLGRFDSIFEPDFMLAKDKMKDEASRSTFVVVGGAGTIGSSVVRLLVSLGSKKVQVVDISENNLVELIRDIRSSKYDIVTELETYVMDCGSEEFERYFKQQPSVDYLLNFSALKHVRSEKDVYTLKRLIDVNIINSVSLLNLAEEKGCKKYFSVSTDKATSPESMMGASKLLMEKFILSQQLGLKVSSARFANVAFSDGSLLYGFEHRLNKKQALAIPTDIRRFFVTRQDT